MNTPTLQAYAIVQLAMAEVDEITQPETEVPRIVDDLARAYVLLKSEANHQADCDAGLVRNYAENLMRQYGVPPAFG